MEKEIEIAVDERSADYFETLRLERLAHSRKLESLELRERELALAEKEARIKAEQERDFDMSLARKKALAHYSKGFEELVEKDAEEAQATSKILNEPFLTALIGDIVKKVSEQK